MREKGRGRGLKRGKGEEGDLTRKWGGRERGKGGGMEKGVTEKRG